MGLNAETTCPQTPLIGQSLEAGVRMACQWKHEDSNYRGSDRFNLPSLLVTWTIMLVSSRPLLAPSCAWPFVAYMIVYVLDQSYHHK